MSFLSVMLHCLDKMEDSSLFETVKSCFSHCSGNNIY